MGDAHVSRRAPGGQGIDKLPGQLDQSLGFLSANPSLRAKSSPEFSTDTGAFDWQVEDDTGGNVVRVERQWKEPPTLLCRSGFTRA